MTVLLCLPTDLESEVVEDLSRTDETHLVQRRCADLTEVIAAARAHLAQTAIISGDIDTLDATLVAELAQTVAVVVVAGSRSAAEIRRLGDVEVLSAHAHEISARIRRDKPIRRRRQRPHSQGKMVVVWGPRGSHGRSMLVRDLGAVAAAQVKSAGSASVEPTGTSEGVLVVDADTHSPSLAQVYGVEESSAIIAVARQLDQGRDGTEALHKVVTRPVGKCGKIELLVGLNTGERWKEISAPVADRLWTPIRTFAPLSIVDVSGGLEQRVERQDRYAVTRSALGAADVVLHVAAATPVGMRRLIEHVDVGVDIARQARHIAVLTGMRASAVGVGVDSQVDSVLGDLRFPFAKVSDDRRRLDAVLLSASAMPVVYSRSAYSKDVTSLWTLISDSLGVETTPEGDVRA